MQLLYVGKETTTQISVKPALTGYIHLKVTFQVILKYFILYKVVCKAIFFKAS